MKRESSQTSIKRVEVIDFSAKVRGNYLFEKISTTFESGSITLLYGPRGSGKSAFLRSFAKLNEEIYPEIIYSGSILFDGKDLKDFKEHELRQLVTYLDTNYLESMDYLTLREIIHLVFGKKFKFSVEEYASTLDEFGVLKALHKFEKTPLSSLYVLEKIGLLLFISSLKLSSLLIFDCILDHLDDEHVEKVTNMLKNMARSGKIVVIATRTLKRFLALADTLTVMNCGKFVYSGRPDEFILEGSP